MIDNLHLIEEIILWIFLLYGLSILLIYSWIGVYAHGAIKQHRRKNILSDFSLIATNPNAPKFSLIAPAYNEGKTIVENVRSLLSLYYPNLEIIIVNDGSKDDSIEKLIESYQLEKVSFVLTGNVPTKEIKAVYRSKNPAFKRLVLVDKCNGGKADALNVGVNISDGDYIVCIDVDCILEEDAILKLAKPFLEQTDKPLIACGGTIRLANNCRIENGKVVEVSLPKSLLGKSQALEYIRAFVLGRMAWSRASGLILISGAFGAFDRKIVLACGGYDPKTVGEDMELVVRMRRYMEEQRLSYQVLNIPDPLCWTEVPETEEILTKQRNRWMRGTMETLWKHRTLLFNPRYGRLGMVSMPYWFFFELIGPLLEFVGYGVLILFFLLGIINWPFFFAILGVSLLAGITYSIYAIFIDLMNYKVYAQRKDLSKLILAAIIEPFYFHPLVVRSAVSGFRDYWKKKHVWGDMVRRGFQEQEAGLSFSKRVIYSLKEGLKWLGPSLLFLNLSFLLIVGLEILLYSFQFNQAVISTLTAKLFMDNLDFILQLSFVIGASYLLIFMLRPKLAYTFLKASIFSILIFELVLILYFITSYNLLGADIRYYSLSESFAIVKSAGLLNWKIISLTILCLLAFYFPIRKVSNYNFKTQYFSLIVLFLGFISLFIRVEMFAFGQNRSNEFENNISQSKWSYFFDANWDDLVENSEFIANAKQYFNQGSTDAMLNTPFPFLHERESEDILGIYLQKSDTIPNLVFLVVEGLGHAYSSADGYVGNFTPFIDSLSYQSLFWQNTLTSTGRTFGVLPTLTGSLPFDQHGFLEKNPTPLHFNLFNILKKNHFETGFYYGGKVEFDHVINYLVASNVDQVVGQHDFEENYALLPSSNGESWGYDDQSLLQKYMADLGNREKPYFNYIMTLSSHSPFLINRQAHYEALFDKRLKALNLHETARKLAIQQKKQLVTMLNVDDAIRNFINEYKQRKDFKHTIFVITGDHSMPEVPIMSKVDRYHVPLIIYSPLLKESKIFKNMVSHFDVAPSIVAYYKNNYGLYTPEKVTWLGEGLGRNAKPKQMGIPIMQSKDQLEDYVFNEFYFNKDNLYRLSADLDMQILNDDSKKRLIKAKFEEFKTQNNIFSKSGQLMPDSVYHNYMNSEVPKNN